MMWMRKQFLKNNFEQIQLYLDHNFPPPTMKSGLMNVNHNYPDNLIDEADLFCQYICLLLREYKGTNIQTSHTQVRNAQLDGG